MDLRILPDSPKRAFDAVADALRAEVRTRFLRVQVRGLVGILRRNRAVDRQVRRRLARLNAVRYSSPINV
jgi:hypothetical protein